VALAVALGGCGGGGSDRRATSTPSPPSTPAPATATPTATAARPLEDKWYVDDNRNAIPDFIETAVGADPATDACLPDQCKLPAGFDRDQVTRGENTLLILDSSGSMAASAGGGQSKIAAAKSAIRQYVRATPTTLARFGFEVYGHKGSNSPSGKARSCESAEVLAPIGRLGRSQVSQVLRRFSPTGYTPIAGALRTASRAFAGREGERNRILLVTDGIETCGGDPVAAARGLKRSGVKVTVDVVGLDIGKASDRAKLRRIAESTGGRYTDARSGQALYEYFNRRVREQRRLIGAIGCLRSNAQQEVICRESLYQKADEEITVKYLAPALGAGDQARATALREIDDRLKARGGVASRAVRDREEARIARLERELRASQRAAVKRP